MYLSTNDFEQASFAAEFRQELKGMFTKHKTLVRARTDEILRLLHGRRRHLHMTSLKLRCDPSKLHLYWIPVTDNTEKPPQLRLQWTPQWSNCEFVKSSETFWVIFWDAVLKKFCPLWNSSDRATVWKSEWICEFLGIYMCSQNAGFQAQVGVFERKQRSELFWDSSLKKFH